MGLCVCGLVRLVPGITRNTLVYSFFTFGPPHCGYRYELGKGAKDSGLASATVLAPVLQIGAAHLADLFPQLYNLLVYLTIVLA